MKPISRRRIIGRITSAEGGGRTQHSKKWLEKDFPLKSRAEQDLTDEDKKYFPWLRHGE